MLALADDLGVPFAGYRLAGAPRADRDAENVVRFTGADPDEITLALDGCGVPSFGISVYRMALAYARLMAPPAGIPVEYREAARVVREAMMAHPYLVAGRDGLDTDLMQAMPGAIVSKGGAGGVQCFGLPGGIGIALKIEDGGASAHPGGPTGVAALEALRQLGVLDEATRGLLAAHAAPAVRSVAGERAGELRPVFELRA